MKEDINEMVFDETIELKDNAMLKHYPELIHEWHFEKNDELGFSIYKITRKNGSKVWWTCLKCKESYYSSVASKTRVQGSGCPYCAGKKVNQNNSLASQRSDIASEWHPTKNGDLSPHDVTCSQATKVWWLGKCGHAWDAVIHSRTRENHCSCPYCSGHKILKGFNDMWTTNPDLASLLANPDDGYKYMQRSHQKVDWKCLECGNVIKNKSIDSINIRSFSCVCSDSISFGEKFIYYLLKDNNIKFKFDEPQEWSGRKRYDFFFESKGKTYIIEVHGGQHYKESFSFNHNRAKTLEIEQENDKFKEELAKENGIENYIIIDARESTVVWISNSILNSDIVNIIDCKDVDFEKIGRLSSRSLIKIVCDLWNSRALTMAELVEKVNVSNSTVISYLKRGTEIGWCDYVSGNRKPVVQLSKNLDFIHAWSSSQEAGTSLGFDGGLISGVCNGKRKTANGFRWMFKEDYEEYLVGNIKMSILISKHAVSVVQLDKELNLIETFLSQTEASMAVGISSTSSAIPKVCQGKYKHKTAGGFKWMYKKDYDKMIQDELSYEEYMLKYYPKAK